MSAAATTSENNHTTVNENALVGRELEWATNSARLLKEQNDANGPIIRTRFPPEPNGYLHIGHAKSMNMNFSLAFDKLGVPLEHRRTVFRYDDTNPDAETSEYIDSLLKDVMWLGWKPERTSYSSDNFEQLYNFAVILIEKGLAYVCDFTKDEMEAQRELAKRRVTAVNNGKDADIEAPLEPALLPGRNRDTSAERNLRMFRNMRRGVYPEGSYTLRLKMDFTSSNPNMYDLVAYRIKFTEHPHCGDKWCIYPSYDFTHGICDSLERIDYSICTLEFETRREPYFWILQALDLYRPKVYEMSRLNVAYTVLSKRKLLKLVDQKLVRGWDDPRMPTISGLRRRGFTKTIINTFCNDVGATRAMNVVEIEKLNQVARLCLSPATRRAMAAIDPIEVEVTNWDEASTESMDFEVMNSPTDPSLGSHHVTMTKKMYIDSSDFRPIDSPQYYGLAPNKAVGLKYHGGNLICDTVITSGNDKKVTKLLCRLDKSENRLKPKSHITWVPDNGIRCEVRIYNNLFSVPEPSDRWEEELNPSSEVLHTDSIVDPSVMETIKNVDRWNSNAAFQFERQGYFVVDTDTTFNSLDKTGKLVFNRTVSLKEEVFKKEITEEEARVIEERREKSKRDKLAKETRMLIDPIDFFRKAPEFEGKYSQYNDEGVPTHAADGKELTKSALKKLTKDKAKHVKQFTNFHKQK